MLVVNPESRSMPNQRSTSKPLNIRSAAPTDQARKLQRLAQLTAELRDGTQPYFEITRLTTLKSLCQERATAQRFALHLAQLAQAKLLAEPWPRDMEVATWRQYQTLAAEAVSVMQACVSRSTAARQARLSEVLDRVQAAQSETTRPLGKYTVRIIESVQLLVIENGLACFTAVEPDFWAYQAARRYAECYNPRYGTGLIRESVPMLEDILQFWQTAPS